MTDFRVNKTGGWNVSEKAAATVQKETIRSYIRAVKIGMERKESQELSQDSECEAKRKASSLILMA